MDCVGSCSAAGVGAFVARRGCGDWRGADAGLHEAILRSSSDGVPSFGCGGVGERVGGCGGAVVDDDELLDCYSAPARARVRRVRVRVLRS